MTRKSLTDSVQKIKEGILVVIPTINGELEMQLGSKGRVSFEGNPEVKKILAQFHVPLLSKVLQKVE
jgi:hypothetical protein